MSYALFSNGRELNMIFTARFSNQAELVTFLKEQFK